MFLRVSDQLISWLVAEARLKDNMKKNLDSFSSDNYPTIKLMEQLFAENSINFKFFTTRKSKELDYTDLQGPDKEKLCSMNFAPVLAHLPAQKSIAYHRMWKLLGEIYTLLKIPIIDTTDDDQKKISEKITEFTNLYVATFQAKTVTPYVHIMRYHIIEMVKIHGNISNFTQHGLEKLNDVLTKSYFRGSNMRRKESLLQMMFRQYQIQMFTLSAFMRPSAKIHHCSLCRSTSHRMQNGHCPNSN